MLHRASVQRRKAGPQRQFAHDQAPRKCTRLDRGDPVRDIHRIPACGTLRTHRCPMQQGWKAAPTAPRPSQSRNASSSIVSRLAGRLRVESRLHPSNARQPIDTTLSGKFRPVSDEQFSKVLGGTADSPALNSTVVRAAQSKKAPVPNVETPSGSLTRVSADAAKKGPVTDGSDGARKHHLGQSGATRKC